MRLTGLNVAIQQSSEEGFLTAILGLWAVHLNIEVLYLKNDEQYNSIEWSCFQNIP